MTKLTESDIEQMLIEQLYLKLALFAKRIEYGERHGNNGL